MKKLFINLPVTDMQRSKEFYLQLGFLENPVFSGESQICMAWGEQVLVMLQSREFFEYGSKRQLANPHQAISASFTLPLDSPEKVAEIMAKGISAGGKEIGEAIDEGFMQVRSLADPDGHIWGIMYLDMGKYLETRGGGKSKRYIF